MYAGTNLDNSVSVTYSGSGSTATVIFKIGTSSSFATKNLNLGCVISGTSTFVYSSNTIALTVNGCSYTNVVPSPSAYKFTLNQNGG